MRIGRAMSLYKLFPLCFFLFHSVPFRFPSPLSLRLVAATGPSSPWYVDKAVYAQKCTSIAAPPRNGHQQVQEQRYFLDQAKKMHTDKKREFISFE